MTRLPLITVLGLGLLATGCPGKDETAPPTPATADTAQPTVAAAASASAAAPAEDYGTAVKIPAGSLKAGSRCFDIPRIRPDELEDEEVSLGDIEMDLYPYPNQPGKPALVNVTQVKAAELCAARGKRLCTELEWERACKGPKNTTYMWGNGFNKNKCKGQKDGAIGSRPECKTELGVMDMMGVALEWTSSDWERGTPSGDKVVRGARADVVSWLSARCTHSRKRNPHLTYKDVGFRCCSGPVNAAKVVLRQKKQSPVEDETAIDVNFEQTLMKSMPREYRGIVGVELSFDKVWRWHPVANEEMIIARWKGKPQDSAPFYLVTAFKMCGRAWRAQIMRGPVEWVGPPKAGVNPNAVSFDVKTGGDTGTVTLKYWHGTVNLGQPSWVKKGNTLGVDSKPALRLKDLPRLKIKK